jgi:hypothetical protein
MVFDLLILSLFSETPQIADAERLAVEHRRALTRGEVVTEFSYSSTRHPNLASRRLHIWWDGTSFRQDMLAGDERHIDVWSGDKYIRWTDNSHAAGENKVAVTVAFANDKGVIGISQPRDPRRLGLVTSDFLNIVHYPLDKFLTNPARRNTTVTQEEYDGVICTLVTITTQNRATVRAWIAADRGYNVLKMDASIDHGGSRWTDTIETEVEQVTPGMIWFPTRYHYKRTLKGADVEEQGTIQVVSLNEPIPPEVFTLQGIGVPPGWPVTDHTRPDINTPLAWDGSRIVSVTKAQREIEAAWRLNIFYAACAVVLALVSAVLFWRFLSLRQAT